MYMYIYASPPPPPSAAAPTSTAPFLYHWVNPFLYHRPVAQPQPSALTNGVSLKIPLLLVACLACLSSFGWTWPIRLATRYD